MMDAFELHKFLHAQIKTEQEFIAPVVRKIEPINVSPNLTPDILTPEVNLSQSSFPWAEVIILGGAIILGIYLISKIPRRDNYQTYFERRRKRSMG